MDLELFFLETVRGGSRGFLPCPSAGALQADIGREVENEGDIGHGCADGNALERCHQRRLDIAGDALIHTGGIDEAVAENDIATGKRWPDHAIQMIGTGSGKQERFHAHTKGLGRPGKEHMAEGFSTRRSARLACGDDRLPIRAQVLGQQTDLGRFTGPLASLETHEQSARRRQCLATSCPKRFRTCPLGLSTALNQDGSL